MDFKRKRKRKQPIADEIPSIVVECPMGSKLPYTGDEYPELRGDSYLQSIKLPDKPSETSTPISTRKSSLRRNSISLPNLDDYELQEIKDESENIVSN